VQTDDQGNYSFYGVAPGHYKVVLNIFMPPTFEYPFTPRYWPSAGKEAADWVGDNLRPNATGARVAAEVAVLIRIAIYASPWIVNNCLVPEVFRQGSIHGGNRPGATHDCQSQNVKIIGQTDAFPEEVLLLVESLLIERRPQPSSSF
jgi:hypothetical protein